MKFEYNVLDSILQFNSKGPQSRTLILITLPTSHWKLTSHA